LTIQALSEIPKGHKIALRRIEEGRPVIKYGVEIGIATRTIEPGEWVHLHNCRSRYDERSSTLDVISGAPTDTPYL
jgi:altronate dehydratase